MTTGAYPSGARRLFRCVLFKHKTRGEHRHIYDEPRTRFIIQVARTPSHIIKLAHCPILAHFIEYPSSKEAVHPRQVLFSLPGLPAFPTYAKNQIHEVVPESQQHCADVDEIRAKLHNRTLCRLSKVRDALCARAHALRRVHVLQVICIRLIVRLAHLVRLLSSTPATKQTCFFSTRTPTSTSLAIEALSRFASLVT